MSVAVSVRCAGLARIAMRRGVATAQRTEASVAWAREGRTGERGRRVEDEGTGLGALQRRGGASGHGIATAGSAARSRWRGREGGTTTTAEVTTTTRAGKQRDRWCGAMWVEEIDDNYNGGDDNYPRVVVVQMGVQEREEGRGWHRQK